MDQTESQVSFEISTEGIQRFLDLSVTFKSSGFASERESRILVTTQNGEPIHHRVNAFGITPFVKLKLPTKSIKSIRVGPTDDFHAAVYSLTSLFSNNKDLLIGENAQIQRSAIPFRG